MTQSLTITLSDPIYRYLQEVAVNTKQPLEQVVQQSIAGNLPPRLPDAPHELQLELLAMQQLSLQQLRTIAEGQISPQEQQLHLDLLEKNSRSMMTAEERRQLETVRTAADRLMVRKAYAWALLRWRGVSLPRLDDLPVD
jgi:hypothetical protein